MRPVHLSWRFLGVPHVPAGAKGRVLRHSGTNDAITNLAALSLDGKRFFYENMLRRAQKLDYKLIWPLTRSEYILSYCCPPNLARTIAQSSEYAYLTSDNSVWTGIRKVRHR